MLETEEKEIIINEELKRKIEIICRFANAKPIFFNGSTVNIKGTNIAYLKPHSVVINEINYLLIDNSNDIFIENLNNKISINELEKYIKNTMKKM
jgi:hypothetical protein